MQQRRAAERILLAAVDISQRVDEIRGVLVPGEQIEVIEEIRPGGDPIAVRIGTSMFALRRREAQAVLVRLERPEAV